MTVINDPETAKRISAILGDYWIDYPQAKHTLSSILAMLEAPRRYTAPCMLITGVGGSGKSSIVQQLMKRNPSIGSPMVFTSLVENAGNLKIRQLILEAIGLPTRLGGNKGQLPQEIAQFLSSQGKRALVIDELHDALVVSKNELLRNLSLLKGLSGPPFHISVIGLGLNEARNAISSDPQLFRRFHQIVLNDWRMDDDFRNFLATLERFVALKKPSDLHSEPMVRLIHRRSKGLMDDVVKIVKSAAIYAIRSGEENITADLIEKAFLEPWGYNNL